MPRRSKENRVSRSGTAVCMRGRVLRVVVRPEIGLDFHNASGKNFSTVRMRQELAQQERGHHLRRTHEKGSRELLPR